MEKYAELEISLHHRAEGEYAVGFRYSQPGSDVDAQLAEQGQLRLDPAELRTQKLDPEEYARNLTTCFFQDTEIKTQFARARSSAEALNLPLSVRLLISPNASELHTIFWEQLLDPVDETPLFTGEKIYFSRYISSQNLRPVKLPQKTAMRALVFIANPINASKMQSLDPIDADGEFERARKGLNTIPVTRFSEGPATINNLVQTLRAKKPHILYLVCHGGLLQGEPFLWFEDDDGQAALTPARELVTRLKELNDPPLLVVLPACESGGFDSLSGDARSALGPRLAEAGVPAVVAMHGSITMKTVEKFMPGFFNALQEDGQVDRAMALARGSVRERFDYWMPVLFTRLKTGCIFAEPAAAPEAPPRPRTWRFWAAICAAALVVLAAAFGAYQYATRPPWLGEGYNVIVATFTETDASGRERVTDNSRQFSAYLYKNIEQEKNDLEKITGFDLVPPEKIGPIRGKNHSDTVRWLAEQTNASLIIYGTLMYTDGLYQVVPEFYINGNAFTTYSGELIGAHRLGKAIPLGPEFNEQTAAGNPQLKIRARVLRSIITGVSFLISSDYPRAELAFQDAAYDPEWADEDGKEVAFLLLGAAQLLPYDSKTNPGVLPAAQASFIKARDLKTEYPRPYLGLGEVALLSATIDKGPQVQAGLITEAEKQFHLALERAEPGSLSADKAAYGLGRAALLRFDRRLPGWAQEDAASAEAGLRVMITAYDAGKDILAFQAAEAHILLGRLAGWKEDWAEMAKEARQAVDILDSLRGSKALTLAARAWEYQAMAERNRGNVEAAQNAYRQAIEIGKTATVSPTEVQRWEDAYQSLKKGTP